MPIKVTCWNCGKDLLMPDRDAGLVGMCPACGIRLDIPRQLTPGDQLLGLTQRNVESAQVVSPISAASAVSAASPEGDEAVGQIFPAKAEDPEKSKRPVRQTHHMRTAMGLILLIAALTGGTLYVLGKFRIFRPVAGSTEPSTAPAPGGISDANWERANHDKILTLAIQADTLSIDFNHLKEAYEKYQELKTLVGGRTIVDPYLRSQIASAAESQQKIHDKLLSESLAQYATQHRPDYLPPPTTFTTPHPQEPSLTTSESPVVSRPGPTSVPVVPDVPRATDVMAVLGPRPAIRQQRYVPEGITDDQIGASIRRGVDLLMKHFARGEIQIASDKGDAYHAGVDALAVYTLLQCGDAIKDDRLNPNGPFMGALLDRLKSYELDTGSTSGHDHPITYARALRATALAFAGRPDDRDRLTADVDWLVQAANGGAYSYDDHFSRLPYGDMPWDNSNTQYGLLGVWSGAEVGVEVPDTYWNDVRHHWETCQRPDGRWSYRPADPESTYAMTVAGIASMYVATDYFDPHGGDVDEVERPPMKPELAKAMTWLDTGDDCLMVNAQSWYDGYNLFGLERVGLASGLKYFGNHDWYKELSGELVDNQWPDGRWYGLVKRRNMAIAQTASSGEALSEDSMIDTAYSLLYLSRGRHPILMNKLQFDGFWANRPRDVANLARYARRALEKPLNWQVMPLSRDVSEWMDTPILYIASDKPMNFLDEDAEKLREFVKAGGMIFVQQDQDNATTDAKRATFDGYVAQLAHGLFPQYELQDVPANSELYHLVYDVKPQPPLKYVTNGSRILMVYSPTDIAESWQQRKEKTDDNAFALGVNMFVYNSGKTDLRNRLASPYIPPLAKLPEYRITVARLKYTGNWDPEPGAWDSFGNWFSRETGYAAVSRPVALANLHPSDAPFAHLTGNDSLNLSDEEVAALKKYVEAGGVVLIDSCGGNKDFNHSLYDSNGLLDRAFPDADRKYLENDDPLLAGGAPGMDDLTQPKLRPQAQQTLASGAWKFRMIRFGKGAVILSAQDLTTGLVGSRAASIIGFEPDYARKFVKNALIWTADGKK